MWSESDSDEEKVEDSGSRAERALIARLSDFYQV